MGSVISILFCSALAFGQPAGDDARDLGPVNPEFATVVKQVEQVSCARSSQLDAAPFRDCERLRRELRGTFVTIKRYRDQYEAESGKLREALSGRADIDSGSQCGVAVISDRTYAFARTLEDRTILNVKFARKVEEGLGPKPWPELRAVREKAAKVACYGACQSRGLQACESKCRLELSLLGQFEQATRFRPADMVPSGAGFLHFRAAEAELKALSAAARKARKELEASLQRTRKLAGEAQATGRRIAQRYDCERLKKEMEAKVKRATVYVDIPGKGERGSGVFVRTQGPNGEETHLLTARHVPGARDDDGEIRRLLPVETTPSLEAEAPTKPGVKASGASQEQFHAEPGRVHAGDDLISKPVARVPDALGVVPAGTRPEIGQEFFVSGHPGSHGNEFVAHRCTFQGYGTGDWGSETHYYMNCPSAVGGQWGMSGGPMYDTSGRVWGVASQQPGFSNLIQVAPVSETSDGKLQLGLQETFLTDYCRSPDAPGFRRCQIIPGYSWSARGP